MIRKSDKLVEATMLALQGKLELKENKSNNKRADKFIKDYFQHKYDLETLHNKLAPLFNSKKDAVEYLADNENRIKKELKKTEGIDVNVDNTTTVSVEGNETIVDTQDATVIVSKKEDEFVPETSDDLPIEAPVEEPVVDAPVAPDEDIVEVPADDTVMPEEVVDEPVDTELPTEESKKFESVEIEVSDDGKEVEVTTDNGEEVEVKDETPEEGKDTETEVPADDEPSIDEMIEENKKITEDINESNVRKAAIELNQKDKDMGQETATMTGMIATRIADIAEELGDDYSEWLDTDDVREIADTIVTSKMWTEFNNQLDDVIRETIEDKVDWIRRDEPASRYYEGNPDLDESKKIEAQSPNIALDAVKWTFGLNNKEARDYIKANKDKIDNIVKGYLDNAKKNFYNEGKKVEDTEEYLEPRYDTRNSFYKKAKVVTKDNGDEELYSYGTHVGGVRAGKPYSKGKFSQTTSRHQKEFFKQRGVDPNKVDVEEGKQADRNEEEIKAKKSHCINCENKQRSAKVQEMIARRQKKSEALNSLNKTVKRHRAVLEHKKIQEAKNDLGINEEVPKKEEPVPNTAEANLKVENKFSSKSFNEALTKYYKDKILAVESVEVTKLSKTRTGLKLEANLLSKSGKLKRAICLEMKQIQTGKSFDKYEVIETKGLVKENKSDNTKTTMTTFTNKQNIIECRYILTK